MTSVDLIKDYVEAYNRFDVAGMLALLSDDIIFVHQTGKQVTASTHGKAAFRALANLSAEMFSARKQTILALAQRDETIVCKIEFSGTFGQDLLDGTEAGQTINRVGQSEFLIHAGRITKIRDRV